MRAVYRHSRGFPRLINTICENALITAYARQMQSVTPDIIDDVAKEFRLDVVHSSAADTAGGQNGMDVQRAIKRRPRSLFSSARSGRRANRIVGAPLGVQVSKHEPYF